MTIVSPSTTRTTRAGSVARTGARGTDGGGVEAAVATAPRPRAGARGEHRQETDTQKDERRPRGRRGRFGPRRGSVPTTVPLPPKIYGQAIVTVIGVVPNPVSMFWSSTFHGFGAVTGSCSSMRVAGPWFARV